jgi:hypothetical protein
MKSGGQEVHHISLKISGGVMLLDHLPSSSSWRALVRILSAFSWGFHWIIIMITMVHRNLSAPLDNSVLQDGNETAVK